MAPSQVEKVSNYLWRSAEGRTPAQIYALVDAARSEVFYPKIVGSVIEYSCLHGGKKAEELAWVAPYLVTLKREDPFTRWLLENGWGRSWGVFVESPLSFNELKRHFQTFLTVYDEQGKSFYFRYYDPRVLRVYLPTCNSEELQIVFGAIDSFMLEDGRPSDLLRYTRAGKLLQTEKISLA